MLNMIIAQGVADIPVEAAIGLRDLALDILLELLLLRGVNRSRGLGLGLIGAGVLSGFGTSLRVGLAVLGIGLAALGAGQLVEGVLDLTLDRKSVV